MNSIYITTTITGFIIVILSVLIDKDKTVSKKVLSFIKNHINFSEKEEPAFFRFWKLLISFLMIFGLFSILIGISYFF